MVVPFFEGGRQGEEYAIVILDLYSVHRAHSFREWVKARCAWMIVLFVPGVMTPILQVMNLIVNVGSKKHINAAFEVYLHAFVKAQRQQGKAWKDITFDLGKKVIRQVVYQWMPAKWDSITLGVMKNGRKSSTLLRAWDVAFQCMAVELASLGTL